MQDPHAPTPGRSTADDANSPKPPGGGLLAQYQRVPLYLKIVVGLVLGVLVGLKISPSAASYLNVAAVIMLRFLGAIAPPLILFAVVRALITANVKGKLAGRMFFLLVLNTLVAIFIGLLVANVIRPGIHSQATQVATTRPAVDPAEQFLNQIPKSFLGPLVENNVIGVIIIAVAVGIAARKLAAERTQIVLNLVETGFDVIVILLHWVIALVPLAVFGKVAYIVATQGFEPFKALGWFILAVLMALFLQATYYLTRIRFGSWVSPFRLIRETRDALAMAFSTASSTATMPVTYDRLRRVGLRQESASLGALVGSNFNNDGTALYEAMSALFVAQMIGQDLTLLQQFMVVLTSVVASVGAAGIPEAGLVTMTLVFNAVGLPVSYIFMLLPVDWFLDRCRTTINVMGDMNVSCMLDGKTPLSPAQGLEPVITIEAPPTVRET